MRIIFAAVFSRGLLVGCASLRPEHVPTASELAGTYFMGDGLGICMQVTLRSDGSLSGTNCSGEHIGTPSHDFVGSWSLDGANLKVSTPAGEIKDAEAFFWQGNPAFVELENKRGNQVSPRLVFRRSNP